MLHRCLHILSDRQTVSQTDIQKWIIINSPVKSNPKDLNIESYDGDLTIGKTNFNHLLQFNYNSNAWYPKCAQHWYVVRLCYEIMTVLNIEYIQYTIYNMKHET